MTMTMQMLEDRCQLLEERMSQYDKLNLGYTLLKDNTKTPVLVKKRKRNYIKAGFKDDYFTELDESVQMLQSKGIRINNRNLRALGYGSVLVNRYLKAHASKTGLEKNVSTVTGSEIPIT